VADTYLLGDIGGTNARFALFSAGEIGPIARFTVADYPAATDAIAEFLAWQKIKPVITTAVLGVAGPVVGDRCVILNSHWVIDGAQLRAAFGWHSVALLNDFEALALALPRLGGSDLYWIGGGAPQAGAPMVVLGPGTGLGLAALVPYAGATVPIATEGGHTTLPATNAGEDAVIDHLRGRFGHVSAERALSGPGLENLYRAVAAIDGSDAPARNARDITQAALAGTCATSRAALDMFCALLGTYAGDLALIFRARGGVYIAGGIAPRIKDYLSRSEFRSRFEAKGRFRGYLEAIPTNVIIHPDTSFLGLKSFIEQQRAATGQK
jgi:glucokinase